MDDEESEKSLSLKVSVLLFTSFHKLFLLQLFGVVFIILVWLLQLFGMSLASAT